MNQLALGTSMADLEREVAMPCQACDRISQPQRFLLLSLSAVVALVAHLLFLLLLPQPWHKNQSSDYVGYYEPVAHSLIAGNGFYLHSKPALTYPPGIPMPMQLHSGPLGKWTSARRTPSGSWEGSC